MTTFNISTWDATARPVSGDSSEHGLDYIEAVECEVCGQIHLVSGMIECDHSEHVDSFNEDGMDLIAHLHEYHGDEWALVSGEGGFQANEWEWHEEWHEHNEQDPEYLDSDGPVGSRLWPCPIGAGIEKAALAVRDLPLVIVQDEQRGDGFVLSGGGMDLSWAIAAAYALSGFAVPLVVATALDAGTWRNVLTTEQHLTTLEGIKATVDEATWAISQLTKLQQEDE